MSRRPKQPHNLPTCQPDTSDLWAACCPKPHESRGPETTFEDTDTPIPTDTAREFSCQAGRPLINTNGHDRGAAVNLDCARCVLLFIASCFLPAQPFPVSELFVSPPTANYCRRVMFPTTFFGGQPSVSVCRFSPKIRTSGTSGPQVILLVMTILFSSLYVCIPEGRRLSL